MNLSAAPAENAATAARTVARISAVAMATCWTPDPKKSVTKRDERVRWLWEPFSTSRRAPLSITWLWTTPPGSITAWDGIFRASNSVE